MNNYMYKLTRTKYYEGLNKDHTAVAVYEYEYTVWYLWGWIPVWYWESNAEIVLDKYNTENK